MLVFLTKSFTRILYAILKFPSRRCLVPTQPPMDEMAGYLKADLRRNGLKQVDRISHSVALIIVQEALRRAAEKENDGRARCGEFWKQLDLAADQIIAVFSDKEDLDVRIKNILIFNKVL